MIFRNFVFALMICGISPIFAMDFHEIDVENIKSRPIHIPFEAKGKAYALVRASKDDEKGLRSKDYLKSAEERKKFENQFGLNTGLKTIEIYSKLITWQVKEFSQYKFGLFSIYKINESGKTASYMGEVNFDESMLSTNGGIECSYDIDSRARNQGIAKASMQVIKDTHFKELVGKFVLEIHYDKLQKKGLAQKSGFTKSKKSIEFLKLKIGPDNYYSSRIAQSLRFAFNTFTVDRLVSYTYPAQPSPIPQQILAVIQPIIENLTSSDQKTRQEAIGQVEQILSQIK